MESQLLLLAVFFLGIVTSSMDHVGQRRNVLMIALDDMRPLGTVLGEPEACSSHPSRFLSLQPQHGRHKCPISMR